MAQEWNEATRRWLRKERLLQSLAFIIRRAQSAGQKLLILVGIPQGFAWLGWHGDCSAK
jgi:hypothetical protein